MTTNASPNRPRIVPVAAVVALLALAAAYWNMSQDSAEPASDGPEAQAERTPTPVAEPMATAAEPAIPAGGKAAAPKVRIEENGQLTTTTDALREGDVLVLGLALPDDARGFAGLPVKVVDPRGRVIEVEGMPVRGSNGGLRLEIDPEWLQPGRYMIQLKTVEKKPLALRRYVLEIQDS